MFQKRAFAKSISLNFWFSGDAMASMPLAVKQPTAIIPEEVWEDVAQLPCILTIDLPLRQFTVRVMLCLEAGTILESENAKGGHVPVTVNRNLLGWAEFEVVTDHVAIRMTELA